MDAKDKRIAELETLLKTAWEEVVTLKARILQLEAEVVALKTELAAARKNSSNSSKLPSSVIVKPPNLRSISEQKRVATR